MARLVSNIGGEAANDGERRVITRLIDELPEAYGVLRNVEIRDRNGRLNEIDAIVTAPHAVYVVEIKDYTGEIEGDDRQWLYKGREQASPIALNNLKAKILKSIIGEADPLLGSIWVQQVVVLARKPRRLKLTDAARKETLLLDELVPFVTDKDRIAGKSWSVQDLPEQVEKILTPKVRKPQGPKKFGSWIVQETLKQDGDVTHYRARPKRIVVATIIPDIDSAQMAGYGMAGGVASPDQLRQQSDDEWNAGEAVVAGAAGALGIRDAETHVLRGHPGHRLCTFAAEIAADALIVGPRGLGAVKGMLLGSVSSYVVRQAPCPVLTDR